jgi:hypothetical protein
MSPIILATKVCIEHFGNSVCGAYSALCVYDQTTGNIKDFFISLITYIVNHTWLFTIANAINEFH